MDKLDEKVADLFAMCNWFVAVNTFNVNIEDLVNASPGAIVRVNGDLSNNIQVFIPNSPEIGCIAGWISEG